MPALPTIEPVSIEDARQGPARGSAKSTRVLRYTTDRFHSLMTSKFAVPSPNGAPARQPLVFRRLAIEASTSGTLCRRSTCPSQSHIAHALKRNRRGYHFIGTCAQLSGRGVVPRLSSGTLQLSTRCSSFHFSPSRSFPVSSAGLPAGLVAPVSRPAFAGEIVWAPTSIGASATPIKSSGIACFDTNSIAESPDATGFRNCRGRRTPILTNSRMTLDAAFSHSLGQGGRHDYAGIASAIPQIADDLL